MGAIGIIGGSGFSTLPELAPRQHQTPAGPYGEPSGPLQRGRINGTEVVFLARHGTRHDIPPHLVNYRANLWALREKGVDRVIALAAVGGIQAEYRPGELVIPDQILDYTYGRDQTFVDTPGEVQHAEFTEPYCGALREVLAASAQQAGLTIIDHGTYAATQGPRLESAAEVDRLERDGANIVGMTGMPEAALARELGICYAAIAMVVNYAAGRFAKTISSDDVAQACNAATAQIRVLLQAALPHLVALEYRLPPALRP